MDYNNWFEISNGDKTVTPALLVYPERINHNIQLMINLAGGVERLRPHIKTHKSAEIIKLQLKCGITKFKCATIPETELLAESGAKDILLAMQPVGFNVQRFFDLLDKYPSCHISTIVDNDKSIEEIAHRASKDGKQVSLYLDINNGMNRTGIVPGPQALRLYQIISENSNVLAKGVHVYDGHIHQKDIETRKTQCDSDFKPVENLKSEIIAYGMDVPIIVAGGTPTFPIHKYRDDVELSPGTPLLWDSGYGHQYTDLPFRHAAVLATRVVSKPNDNLLCLDLGSKAVASEMSLPRVEFLGNDDFEQVGHNEEHMVVKTTHSDRYKIGDMIYALPIHICPTVIRYEKMEIVKHGRTTDDWLISARSH